MLSNLGLPEIIIIALLIVIFFGGKKIPEFIRGIGEALREFRRSSQEEEDEEDKDA